MAGNIFFALFVVVLAAVISENKTMGRQARSIVVGGNSYFHVKKTSMTWQEAKDHCKAEGGEIAKLTSFFLYNSIRVMIMDTELGSYWIDGKVSSTSYDSSKDCTPDELNLSGIPMPPSSDENCLTLKKDSSAADSGVQPKKCTENTLAGVICALPSTGCVPPPPPYFIQATQ